MWFGHLTSKTEFGWHLMVGSLSDFIPIHVYLPCTACQCCSITVPNYGTFTWRVNYLYSTLVLKACGITISLLLTTCFVPCLIKLTTKRSSWLLQNNSHLFFQEIRKACGRLPKPRSAVEVVACCSSLYGLDTSLERKLCWMLGSIDTGMNHWPRRSLNKLDSSWLCAFWWNRETRHCEWFLFTKE